MRAWTLEAPGSLDRKPLALTELPLPDPGADEVRLRVQACGVCRTDLHVAVGELPARKEKTGLSYEEHLFRERTITSVSANTRADGEELLRLATRLDLELEVCPYPFAEAVRALEDLAESRFSGVAVLEM
jgi:D-arabinose 1-dehydrogenase-like Zn-dependent alcohol dehydrogenase